MAIQGPKAINSPEMLQSVKRYQEAKQTVASSANPVYGTSASNGVGTKTDAPLQNDYEYGNYEEKKEKQQPKSSPVLPDYNNVVLASEMLDIQEVTPSGLVHKQSINSYETTNDMVESEIDE